MGTVYPELDDRLRRFMAAQPVFFVATAPCLTAAGDGGHVNVSPKGCRDTFAVLGPRTVGYLDLTGSGAETIAHLRQNGQITIMFCSFGRAPRILRLYGTGRVVLPGQAEWPGIAAHFAAGASQGAGRGNRRAIITVAVHRIADSCGYGVPVMDLREERDLLARWAERRSPEQLAAYRAERNAVSIDGLPALDGGLAALDGGLTAPDGALAALDGGGPARLGARPAARPGARPAARPAGPAPGT